MTNEEKIAAKEAEIEKYKEILDRYGRGRWYWSYRRTLEALEEELENLRSRSIDGDVPPS